ncbi:MAG TPA: hypothetical protein DCS93_31280 [Microscillaceae bacterium]|nr:hypothetical protein [Microscillaceae bacterium]
MKKVGFIIIFLVISLIGYSQKKVNVPGTKVWMTPPEGAIPGKNFTGFQIGENGAIQIMDLDGGNFYSNTRNYKKENFEAKGVQVLDFQKLTIDGYPAIYAHIKGAEPLASHQLVFGDSTFSISLMANYALVDKTLGQQLKKSIFTAQYKKDHKIDPFGHAPFRLDDTHTTLKFKQYTSNMYLYLPKEEEGKAGQNKQFLLLTPLPGNVSSSLEELAKQAILETSKYGIVLTKVISSQTKKVNGYQAYEIVAKGKIKDEATAHLVVTIIQNREAMVVSQGMQMAGDFDKKAFTELINTIRFKE